MHPPQGESSVPRKVITLEDLLSTVDTRKQPTVVVNLDEYELEEDEDDDDQSADEAE